MSAVFQARFAAALRTNMTLDKSFYNDLFKSSWVVYSKRPFGGPKQVIEYLGRYTHKVTISNHRITGITDNTVSFRYKDYRDVSKNKIMTLHAGEFIRRVLYAHSAQMLCTHPSLWYPEQPSKTETIATHSPATQQHLSENGKQRLEADMYTASWL